MQQLLYPCTLKVFESTKTKAVVFVLLTGGNKEYNFVFRPHHGSNPAVSPSPPEVEEVPEEARITEAPFILCH